MKYLLDTNICIYIIKKKPDELQYGIEKSSNAQKNKEALEKFLTPIEIVDFGYEATIEYGKIRASLEKKGVPIGALDMLIASHAKSLNLTMVTNNVKELIGLMV